MNPDQCLTEEQFIELIDGVSANVPAFQRHVDQCANCRAALGELQIAFDKLSSVCDPEFTAKLIESEQIATTDPAIPRPIGGRPHKRSGPLSFIGKYPVIKLLSDTTGQATIYLVQHPETRQQLVAKVYNTNGKKQSGFGVAESMLREEGETLARLADQDGIAKIYDLDIDTCGPFLIMEYLEGETLRERFDEYSGDTNKCIELFIKIGKAIQNAHQSGVVHLDLKPENIMFNKDDEIRIIDFGLAKIRDAWRSIDSTPWLGGTPKYMAPEQVRKDVSQIGKSTDVFALGAVLQQLLTGDYVYDDKELAGALVNSTDIKACLAPKSKSFPNSVRSVVEKSLQQTPLDRHPNGGEFAAELGRIVRQRRITRRSLIWTAAATPLVLAFAVWQMGWLQKQTHSAVSLTGIVGRENPGLAPGELDDGLPLVKGQNVRIEAEVPIGLSWIVIWIDSESEVSWFTSESEKTPLKLYSAVEGQTQRIEWPASETGYAQLDGPTGTEMAIVCGKKGKFGEKEIDELVDKIKQTVHLNDWPALPEDMLIRCSIDNVKETFSRGNSRSLGAAEITPFTQLKTTIEKIREEIRKEYDFMLGEAFPKFAPN